jgi:hypothetical protein
VIETWVSKKNASFLTENGQKRRKLTKTPKIDKNAEN